MMNNENSFLEHNLSRINEALLESLPEENFSEITKAIHYSVMNGGKKVKAPANAFNGRCFESRCK